VAAAAQRRAQPYEAWIAADPVAVGPSSPTAKDDWGERRRAEHSTGSLSVPVGLCHPEIAA